MNLVYQQPIRFDMTFAEVLQISAKCMISILLRHVRAFLQQLQCLDKLGDIFASLFHAADISFHAIRIDDLILHAQTSTFWTFCVALT